MAPTQLVTNILSLLTVLADVIVIIMLIMWLLKDKYSSKFFNIISKYGTLVSFLAALVATSGSLYYSEIAGYEPCKLCWYQRIFMYPQVLILGIALRKKDKKVGRYVMPLSLLGMVIASYHYLLQIGVAQASSCSAAGAVSCAKRYTMSLGYITIPMMALSAFALIFFMTMSQYRFAKKHNIK